MPENILNLKNINKYNRKITMYIPSLQISILTRRMNLPIKNGIFAVGRGRHRGQKIM